MKTMEDCEQMVWIRDFEIVDENPYLKGKKVVHGHTPVPVQYIRQELSEQAVCIDAGVYLLSRYRFGWGRLVCLDLDTLELVEQRNIDMSGN